MIKSFLYLFLRLYDKEHQREKRNDINQNTKKLNRKKIIKL